MPTAERCRYRSNFGTVVLPHRDGSLARKAKQDCSKTRWLRSEPFGLLVCALALIVFAQSLLCFPSTLFRPAAGNTRWKGPGRYGSIRKSRLWDRFKINPDSLWLATVNFSMHWFMRMLPRGGEGSMGARLRRLKQDAPEVKIELTCGWATR